MAVFAAAFLSPIASHAALATGWGLRGAMLLAGTQAVAVGLVLRGTLPGRWKAAAPLAALALLAALGWGASRSPADGLAAAAGASHAVAYSGLLLLFGHTMLPGQVPLITRVAQRINPWYHDGISWYTRGVTAAWCWFFAAQLLASAVLLLVGGDWWRWFVSTLHMPLVVAMAVAEYAVRRWQLRGEPLIGILDSIRGVTNRGAAYPPAEATRLTAAPRSTKA